MDENVYVAEDADLTIEPGVVVQVVRLPKGPCGYHSGRITLNIFGTLVAEGRPDAMIRFTYASDVPVERDEWSGLRLPGGPSPSILKWVVIEHAKAGIDTFGSPLIAHCIFKHCQFGIYLERDFAGDVRHNVIAYCPNPIACTGTRPEATIINNISYAGQGGIHAWANAAPYADYNLYWSSRIQDRKSGYYRGIEPGPHDLHLDPRFIDPEKGDFRLARGSPARRAGLGDVEELSFVGRIFSARRKGPDIGLFARRWSERAARQDNEEWLADGARSLWYAGLWAEERRRPEEAQRYYEQALELEVPAELRHKIACSLGRALVAQGEHESAKSALEPVIADSGFSRIRDFARRYLAEALASEGRPDDALALLNETEWPQSHVWMESARAEYSLAAGDHERVLSHLERIKDNEPYIYVRTLPQLVSQCLDRNEIDAAVAVSKGFDAYPLCTEAPAAYLDIAKACRRAERPELAVQLLRKSCERDPFSKEAPESLWLLADILESDLEQPEEAAAVRLRLCRGYFPLEPHGMRARRIEEERDRPVESVPRNKMILLDASLLEWSIFDRRPWGSNNYSQHDVIQMLTKAGYTVHANDRRWCRQPEHARLSPTIVDRYGLIICNGRIRCSVDRRIPPDAIETLVEYVKKGGSLLVVAEGKDLWEGKSAEYYNPLVERFGLSFVQNAGLPTGEGATTGYLGEGTTTDHPAVREAQGFAYRHGVPVRTDGGDVLGYVDDDPVIALVRYGQGKVVAAGLGTAFLGDFLGPTRHEAGERHPQNRKLLVALATYLLSGDAQRPATP
jgi:tetratricopeptide (TPR) repeat protein